MVYIFYSLITPMPHPCSSSGARGIEVEFGSNSPFDSVSRPESVAIKPYVGAQAEHSVREH